MDLIPGFKGLFYAEVAPSCTIDDLFPLLRHTLPTFVAIAKSDGDAIPDRCENEPPEITAARTFYQNYYVKSEILSAALAVCDIDSIPSTSDELYKALSDTLDDLEHALSPLQKTKAADACRKLDLRYQVNEPYPRLRALLRILPEEGDLPETDTWVLCQHVRLFSKRAKNRGDMLQHLTFAFDALDRMRPEELVHSQCPLRFSDYPVKHVRKFSKILFGALETGWQCNCNSRLHLKRAMKINLTHHQRFETAPVYGAALSQRKALFRILFPTSLGVPAWQDTDIAVREVDLKDDPRTAIGDNLCRIIEEARANIIPKMMVYDKKLWQLRSEFDRSGPIKVPDGAFKSLRELLEPINSGPSFISKIDLKERVILSFVLVTSFLHLFNLNHEQLQATLTSDNICFHMKQQSANILRPFLNIHFTKDISKPSARNLSEAHWFPDILSLGILLLEIFRGSIIHISAVEDKCATSLLAYDRWIAADGKKSSTVVPDGCFHAVFACLEPQQLKEAGLGKANITDGEVRKYIFERILYPLGDALSAIYNVPLHALHQKIDGGGKAAISLSTECTALQHASRAWYRQLKGVHDAIFHTKFEKLSANTQDAQRTRIAILDTGFELASVLQQNYIDAGKLAAADCKSFCNGEAWDTDSDGHGTTIGKILLDVAPKTQIYVAKVCAKRTDFTSHSTSSQVQENVATAIRHAATVWNADIIVMSFGFDQRIRVISNAMEEVLKLTKPPLFFAATRNDGAHKGMAWPAREPYVFGISATDGDGEVSSFNPDENNAYPIFYAFGESIEVKGRFGKGETESRFVSGTSYATPVAAGLAANLLGCVRLGVKSVSREDSDLYADIPQQLQQMNGMLKVMMHCMQRKNQKKQSSILPWHFLNEANVENGTILKMVQETLDKY